MRAGDKWCCVFAGPTLHFKSPPRDFQAEAGQTARVTCLFIGSPPIASCWIRNNEQVSYSSHLQVHQRGGSATQLGRRCFPSASAKELPPTLTVPKHAEQECRKVHTVCLEAHLIVGAGVCLRSDRKPSAIIDFCGCLSDCVITISDSGRSRGVGGKHRSQHHTSDRQSKTTARRSLHGLTEGPQELGSTFAHTHCDW